MHNKATKDTTAADFSRKALGFVWRIVQTLCASNLVSFQMLVEVGYEASNDCPAPRATVAFAGKFFRFGRQLA